MRWLLQDKEQITVLATVGGDKIVVDFSITAFILGKKVLNFDFALFGTLILQHDGSCLASWEVKCENRMRYMSNLLLLRLVFRG